MSISRDIKNNIIKEWKHEFPSLFESNHSRLYKVFGPVILGVELFKLPRADEYRPYIMSYPLWKPDINMCFKEELIIKEVKNRKGLQFDIPYLKHNVFFSEAVECTKNQLQISFETNLDVFSFIKFLDLQLVSGLNKNSPILQAIIHEGRFYSALYVGNEQLLKDVYSSIEKEAKSWNPKFFERKNGPIVDWLQELQNKQNHRGEFLRQIELNRASKRIARLPFSELVI
jgi:hypothetical protein